jgi:hypothetical protein
MRTAPPPTAPATAAAGVAPDVTTWLTTGKVFLALLVANALLRFWLSLVSGDYPAQARAPGSDESGYLNLARHLVFWMKNGSAVRLPVYPVFLAAFVDKLPEWTLYLVQHALLAGALVRLTRALSDDPRRQRLLLLAGLWFPQFIVLPTTVLTEPLSVSLLFFGLAPLLGSPITSRRLFEATAFFTLLALTRPNFLPLFALVVAVLVVARRLRWVPALAALGLFGLAVFGWCARNHATEGKWVYCTVAGQNAYGTAMASAGPPFCTTPECTAAYYASNLPESLRRSLAEPYFGNHMIHFPIGPRYGSRNDVEENERQLQFAREDLFFLLKNAPLTLLFTRLSVWLEQYRNTAPMVAGSFGYRNYPTPVAVPVLVPLHTLAVVYDDVFFFTSLAGLALAALAWKRGQPVEHAALAVAAFLLLAPLASTNGDRFTTIHLFVTGLLGLERLLRLRVQITSAT